MEQVIYEIKGKPRLRRGNILVKTLDSVLSIPNPSLIRNYESLEHVLDGEVLPRKNYVKVGLVSSYGTVTGEPMKMVVPNFGILYIQAHLNNSGLIDCIYLDPNLIGIKKTEDILSREDLDVLGFSILNTTFRNDLPLIAKAKKYSDKVVLGGPTIETFPFDELFSSLDLDHIIVGDGVNGLSKVANSLLEEKTDVSRVITFPYNTNQRSTFQFDLLDPKKEDCIQEKSYESEYKNMMEGLSLPYNCVGINPLRIKISDNCRGRCSFCTVSKHKRIPESPKRLIEIIKTHKDIYDSMEFEDHELTFHRKHLRDLCELLESSDLVWD